MSRPLPQTLSFAGSAAQCTVKATGTAIDVLHDMARTDEDMAAGTLGMCSNVNIIQLAPTVTPTTIHSAHFPPVRPDPAASVLF